MGQPEPETFRCPTCRASQEWSDTCRRCKSDLRLLREVAESYRENRRQALLAMREGDAGELLLRARLCARLRDDEESRRLLALGTLLSGDWSAAVALARGLIEGGTPPPPASSSVASPWGHPS